MRLFRVSVAQEVREITASAIQSFGGLGALISKIKAYRALLKTGKVAYPTRASFDITERCNLNCRMCFARRSGRRELTIDEIGVVLDNLGREVRRMLLTGGEVFLRDDIPDVISLLKERKSRVAVLTNGTLLSSRLIDQLSKHTNIIGFGFSIDGHEDLHNEIRGSPNAFERTIRAVELTSRVFPCSVNTVVMRENLKQLNEILLLAKELGAMNYIAEAEMFSSRREVESSARMVKASEMDITIPVKGRSSYDYSLDRFTEVKKQLKELSARIGVNFGISPPAADTNSEEFHLDRLREQRRLYCGHVSTVRIDPEGNVVFCQLIRKRFGNLLEQTLKEIWNSDELREFRKTLMKNNLLPMCKRCCKILVRRHRAAALLDI